MKNPLQGLLLHFLFWALQILLYQWSATYWNYPPWTQGHAMIIRLLNERMNYLPLFYGFIFVLGGVCAIHEKKLRSWLQCHFTSSLGVFLLSCAVLVWKFKQYVLAGIPLEDIPAKYMTQLTPEGLLWKIVLMKKGPTWQKKNQRADVRFWMCSPNTL